MSGPPFSVRSAEVRRLYSPHFKIEEISREDVSAAETRMRSTRGVTELFEVCYRAVRLSSEVLKLMAESRISSGRYLAPALVACAAAARRTPRLKPRSSRSIGCSMRRPSRGPPSSD